MIFERFSALFSFDICPVCLNRLPWKWLKWLWTGVESWQEIYFSSCSYLWLYCVGCVACIIGISRDVINSNLSELVGRLEPYFIVSGSNKTFNAIIKDSEKRAIFFANWADTTNFPALYGSGVCLPSPDNTRRHLIYILDGVLYTRYVNTRNLNERPWIRYMPS